jgi:hypothetical protein
MKFKRTTIIKVLSLMIITTLFSFKNTKDIKGWILAGSAPSKYEIGVEENSERNGKVGFLKSTKTKIKGEFGTIMQSFFPEEYLGKRLKLSVYIKSEDVKDWAGMWMRVDGEKGKTLSFDNMQTRPIEGSTVWKQYQIILDVPKESINLSYGVLLSGTGKVWMDSFEFEVVTNTSTTTGNDAKKNLKKPTNTSFDN